MPWRRRRFANAWSATQRRARLVHGQPLVLECNDGYLNDIQRMVLGEADYRQASAQAQAQFAQGAVGAGRGMSSFQLKGRGGLGVAPCAAADGNTYTVGALVLANYGVLPHLGGAACRWGRHCHVAGRRCPRASAGRRKGSIIMLLATDAPLDARQLKRLALRAAAGPARTGSVYGHGSGDIALAFSRRIPCRILADAHAAGGHGA